jgi:glutaminyl-peptide cyclotransferase
MARGRMKFRSVTLSLSKGLWRCLDKLGMTAFLIIALAGCGQKPSLPIHVEDFSGERAMQDVRKLVEFGPRPSGSVALSNSAAYIVAQLKAAGLNVEEQEFSASTPRGPMHFRNIVGKTRTGHGGTGKVILLASHYDTKYFPDFKFVGANDAGSSSGLLLEMARVLSNQPDIWFVFFDGEEAVEEYTDEDGLTGSRFFVAQLKADRQVKWIKAMVLFDMIGDASLNITMPSDCTPALLQQVFDAARATGTRDYFSYRPSETLDDHVPFLLAGIPAVDIIDFDYGPDNKFWHTDKDTLDKLRPKSLETVGKTGLKLVELLERER